MLYVFLDFALLLLLCSRKSPIMLHLFTQQKPDYATLSALKNSPNYAERNSSIMDINLRGLGVGWWGLVTLAAWFRYETYRPAIKSQGRRVALHLVSHACGQWCRNRPLFFSSSFASQVPKDYHFFFFRGMFMSDQRWSSCCTFADGKRNNNTNTHCPFLTYQRSNF